MEKIYFVDTIIQTWGYFGTQGVGNLTQDVTLTLHAQLLESIANKYQEWKNLLQVLFTHDLQINGGLNHKDLSKLTLDTFQ